MGNLEWVFLIVLAVAAVGCAFVINSKSKRDSLSLQQNGIKISRLVKQLLLDVQQHRAMASALLNGDKSFAMKLEKKKSDIERDIAALEACRNPELMTDKCWGDILTGWQSLRKELLTLTPEASFRQHVALIRIIVYLMGDVAERSQIVGQYSIDAALVNTLWSKLPIAAEGLGQARALGAGAAAKGLCNGVTRTRLRFLLGRVGETVKAVSDDLARADATQAANMLHAWQSAAQSVNNFLTLLEEEIIDTEKPSINAAQYFSAATQTIDSLFAVFDQVTSDIEKKLV